MPDSFIVTDSLFKDASVELYHGLREQDGIPVIIKIVHRNGAGKRWSKRLRHEYELLQTIDSPYVLKAIELESRKGKPRLILEDFDGEPLISFLKKPLSAEQFLNVALQLTGALVDMHRTEIVHNALTPANILFNRKSGEVRLTGFGEAIRLGRSITASSDAMLNDRSLAYMSPEQTGRMNREIDHRSDLYSLGVIFYQMLTGKQPFQADDPLEWAYCHIAQTPKKPDEIVNSIPEPLSAIVMKLLAKQAEDRYQTAAGLRVDLKHCANVLRTRQSLVAFPLGRHDVSSRLMIPKKLYGRQREVETLLSAFNQVVASGQPQLVLVSGYSGVGKSAVVNELQKALILPRGLFAAGKFDQYKRDIPYATLAQALQSLVRQVLGKNETEIAQWRQAILEAVGPNGRLVTDLVPDLIALIGEQPPVQEVPPQDAQNRFNTVFRCLLGVFASPEHPLALFFDDLQWLDSATLQLLEHLLSHPDVHYILLLGAYRDNEVDQYHPLMLALESMRIGGAAIESIVLGPLQEEDVLQLVADVFHCVAERAEPLTRLVYEKTGGNPFFTIQFLSTLVDEGLVAFDAQTTSWKWDLVRIREKGYTDNVADLMIAKLNKLPAETCKGLRQLACLGNKAKLVTLALIQGIQEKEVVQQLQEAIRSGLVLQQYDSLIFLHDRVQEAAYALIPKEQRPEVHLRIGRKLLSFTGHDQLSEMFFDIVKHLNQGVELIKDPAELINLAQLNSKAGRRARSSIAYASACDFFTTAANLMPEGSWNSHYNFLLALLLNWAEAEYLRGASDEAERLFEILLTKARSDLDKAAVYELRLNIYPITGRYDDAVAMGSEALRLFKEIIPEDDDDLDLTIQAEAADAKKLLLDRSIEELAGAPETTDSRIIAIIGLFNGMIAPAYIGSRPQLFPLVVLKNLNYTLRYGATKWASNAFSNYAIMLAGQGDYHSAYKFSETALRLSERYPDLGLRGLALLLHGNHINFWLKPFAADIAILEQGFSACLDGGNHFVANLIGFSIVWQAIEQGDALGETLDFSRKYTSFALGTRNEAIYQTIILEQQYMKCLLGETEGSASFSSEDIDELECVEKISKASFTVGVAMYHTMKMMAAYLINDDAGSLFHAEKAEKLLPALMAQPMEAIFYFIHGLVMTRASRKEAKENKNRFLTTLKEYQEKLAHWAANCPANFACKHALLAAEIAEIEHDDLRADQLFEEAITTSRTNGFTHWEAMANEGTAGFYMRRGYATASHAYLRKARVCYAQWGAIAKIAQLDALQPWLTEKTDDEHSPSTVGAGKKAKCFSTSKQALRTETTDSTRHISINKYRESGSWLDIVSLMKANQTLSQTVGLIELMIAMVKLILENAGAQKVFIAYRSEEDWFIEASGNVNDSAIQTMMHLPLAEATGLSRHICRYVVHTGEAVVLANASEEPQFINDPYLHATAVRSVLCMPLQRQEESKLLVYLENNLAEGAFTENHFEILKLLSGQMAISFENALMVENLRKSIIERKQVEEELRRLRNYLSNIINSMPSVLVGVNPNGYITQWNHKAEEVTGITPNNAIDLPFEQTFQYLTEKELTQIRQAIVSKQSWQATRRLRTDNDQLFHEEITVYPLLTEGIEGAVIRIDDVTEKVRLEEMMVQSEKMLSVGGLAAGMAHEINNPLAGMLLTLEAMKKRLEAKDDIPANIAAAERAGVSMHSIERFMEERHVLRMIDGIGKSGQRIKNIVDNMLSFSRKSEGLVAMQSLKTIIEESLALAATDYALKKEYDFREIRIETEYDEALPLIPCEKQKIQQVLLNILSNGAYAMHKAGVAQPRFRIRTWLDNKQGNACIAVADNGPGMDENTRKRIFEPFYTTKPVGEGTGLGLSVSYFIITENHHGEMLVESTPGTGTEFFIYLPLEESTT